MSMIAVQGNRHGSRRVSGWIVADTGRTPLVRHPWRIEQIRDQLGSVSSQIEEQQRSFEAEAQADRSQIPSRTRCDTGAGKGIGQGDLRQVRRLPRRDPEGLRAFNREQVAVGGVALWVSHDGSLGKSFYRAKAEPKPKANHDGPAQLYSNSLFADLSRIKTQIVQEAVAADPSLALDIMLDSLAGQLLHGAHSFQMALEVQAKTVATDVPDELMATSDVRPVEETMATRFASIPSEGRFEAIYAMNQDDKMALLAGLVAMMVDGTVFAGGAPASVIITSSRSRGRVAWISRRVGPPPSGCSKRCAVPR